MIPKIIHYCQFGGKPLSDLTQKCIASWKKYFIDFEIKEWNESHYDVHKIPYISEAYNARKYAFVSDYARFDILYQYGGIYFDTDVEVILPFDDILKNDSFMGFETPGCVNPGLGMGCNAGLDIVYQILDFYASLHFLKNDGSYNETSIVEYITRILKKNGLRKTNTIQTLKGLIIYPTDYFNPKDFITGNITISSNTHSIHHFAMSWFSDLDVFLITRRRKIIASIGNTLITRVILFILNCYSRCIKIGIKDTFSYYINRYVKQNQ
jgi:hypothetical protein